MGSLYGWSLMFFISGKRQSIQAEKSALSSIFMRFFLCIWACKLSLLRSVGVIGKEVFRGRGRAYVDQVLNRGAVGWGGGGGAYLNCQ